MKMRMLGALALVASMTVACGGKSSGATCPTNSTLTYDNFGRSFMARYCDQCHGSGGRTQPNLAGVAQVRANLTAIDSEAAAGPSNVNTDMPQGSPTPTEAERRQLGEWLACGAR